MVEEKIINAHNKLMSITVNGDGAIRMGEALILLRQAIDEIRSERKKANEQTSDEQLCEVQVN